MTQLLEQTIERLRGLSTLPEQEQNRIAERIQRVLSQPAEKVQWFGGRKPSKDERQAAGEGLKELASRNRLGEGVTIRELIDEGRR